MMNHLYLSAYKKLSEMGGTKPSHIVAAGFDGFIDTISKPILSISGDGKKQYFPTISSFGQFIVSKASLSCCIEMDTITKKFGGNMPNYVSALSALGINCDCIGALGYPEVHDIFCGLGENITITSVVEAGKCNALEFDDGKVMLADNDEINSLNFQLLLKRVGKDKLTKWIERSHAFALFCWSELPGMTSVWRGFLDEILPSVIFSEKKLMIIDISDCSRRSPSEIQEMGKMMAEFGKFFTVVFSLNLNECMLISNAFGGSSITAEESGRIVYNALKPHALVIHLLDGVLLYEDGKITSVPTKKIASPKISTGGGDNFNAGLTFALLAGMSYGESAAVANAVSSFYVANGKSASFHELLGYIGDMV